MPSNPTLHLLLETMATEPDLPTVLKTLNLTLEQAYALLTSPEGRAARAQIRRECLAQCQAITQRTAPKALHQLANLALNPSAKPETQLKATQSLLKFLATSPIPKPAVFNGAGPTNIHPP